MKTAMSVLALAAASTALPASYVESHEELLWSNFKTTYGKRYVGSDEAARRAIFKQNMLRGAALEAASTTGVQHGINAFADLTPAEFKGRHSLVAPGGVQPPQMPNVFSETEVLKAKASSQDWRTQNRVTQVKDQGQCGSCWSFSATGSLEGQWSANHSLPSLSEQELVSCATTRNAGCGGGWYFWAWQWLIDNQAGSIVTEASYPYVSGGGNAPKCSLSASMPSGAIVTGYQQLPADEDQIATWLIANGPVSIGVDATSWQTYASGIMSNCISSVIDHAVLAVGVTPDYWIVKNSWASTWGESGYIRLQRGTNQCLMKQYAYYPTV